MAEIGTPASAEPGRSAAILICAYSEGVDDRQTTPEFYCPSCRKAVANPLVCGDCHALICRECGTPLERVDDLGIG